MAIRSKETPEARLISDFWQAMNGNDWGSVADRFLAEDFVALWPLSAEVIEGREQFAHINGAFPGQGGWRFELVSLLAQNDEAVSDIRVTQPDLQVVVRVITFHRIENGLIAQQTEFWPDPYPVPDWRKGMLTVDPERARY